MIDIIAVLESNGPLLGKEILEITGGEQASIWRFCISSPDLITKTVGRRYLRLDRHVEGYARLSPSIMREFSSYTVIGTKRQSHEIDQRTEKLMEETIKISRDKFRLARSYMKGSVEAAGLITDINRSACAIIAGDVVYDMSHREPRQESSTGKMVQGSDLDIVIITDGLDDKAITNLDDIMLQRKYMLLKIPSYREEVDYLIKDLTKVQDQLRFADFESMVACKILDEGRYLYGNQELFLRLKEMLREHGIPEKLRDLEQKAILERQDAEAKLMNNPELLSGNEMSQLFYTTEEHEEFY